MVIPKVIAAIMSRCNAMISPALIGLTSWVLLVDRPRPFCMDSIAGSDKKCKVQIRQAPFQLSWRGACFRFQGRCGLAEGALSPWSLPFLPNLLRPNLLRPEIQLQFTRQPQRCLVEDLSTKHRCPIWVHLFFVAFCQKLCYSGSRKESSFSAAERWRLALLTEGDFCSPISRKEGCPVSTSEVLQLCLVIIGICGLFIQGKKK